jgi:serine/threonine protein kinase
LTKCPLDDLGLDLSTGILQLPKDYYFDSFLGTGATSLVHLVRKTSGERYAFKCYKSSNIANLQTESSNLQLLAAAEVNVPSVIGVIPKLGMVMHPVCTAIQPNLDLAATKRMFQDLSKVLNACAAVQLVHRDIRPSNIGRYGEHFYLIDWGFSVVIDQNSNSHLIVGVDHFLSVRLLQLRNSHAAVNQVSAPTILRADATPADDRESLLHTCFLLSSSDHYDKLLQLSGVAAILRFWQSHEIIFALHSFTIALGN